MNQAVQRTSPSEIDAEVIPHAGFPDTAYLFELLVSDVQWTAIPIATVLMLLTAHHQAERPLNLKSCRHLLNDDINVMRLALTFGSEMGLSQDCTRAVGRLYQRLSLAKTTVSSLILAGGQPGTASVKTLIADWRGVASSAIESLRLLDPIVRDNLPDLYAKNSAVVSEFLREASIGSIHRVNDLGEIRLPDLPQRRRDPRKSLERSCRILASGQILPAILRDVSRNGLGITCNHTFGVGEHVQIELEGGRRLKALVAWCDGSRAGFNFETPLSTSDTLFGVRLDAMARKRTD